MTERKITPCLWFDTQAEEAARFYTSVFPQSKIEKINHYGNEGHEIHGMKPGSVLTVSFSLNGNPFIALNGGPVFRFNEAISFQILCKDQEEIDYYWAKLSEGGEEGQCGWLKDRYGISWQVVPAILSGLLSDPDKSEKVTKVFLQMKKFDIEKLLQV